MKDSPTLIFGEGQKTNPFSNQNMELISNLWASFFSSRQEKKGGPDTASSSQKTAAVKNETQSYTAKRTWTLEDDVRALEERFGDITGRNFEITLTEILSICNRTRKKSDAFKGLVSFLKKNYNTTLTIKSRKHD